MKQFRLLVMEQIEPQDESILEANLGTIGLPEKRNNNQNKLNFQSIHRQQIKNFLLRS